MCLCVYLYIHMLMYLFMHVWQAEEWRAVREQGKNIIHKTRYVTHILMINKDTLHTFMQ
jgi:hypothetical protein